MPIRKPLKIRIGELSERTGQSVHTIRWYEQQGLLPPVPRMGSHRIYSNRHVEWLHLLARLRASGMSVADLRRYTASAQRGAPGIPTTLDLLETHRGRVQEAIIQWERALALVDAKIAYYRQWQATGERPEHATG
ncbi:MerR family transcriptional regulator [Ramlibacter sp.]|uniref:MerR family transcriptional regulator n=1 Tax=Ramlibacter sp. TaxID=1917967 RepID=UPI0035B30104